VNFYLAAIGTRREVIAQLKEADTRGSLLASRIRDTLVDSLMAEPDFGNPGTEDRYTITVHGHSGDGVAPLSLNIDVKSRLIPKTDLL